MSVLDPLDLNLLRTLDVLLQERSVTGAARVLDRSQPAVSHALARLREALGDPLLVRQGRALVPTPRAESLAASVRPLLRELERALAREPEFDPAHSRRTFRLASPDLLGPIVPDLLSSLADAPHVGLELVSERGPDAPNAADLVLDILPDDAPGVVARRLGHVHQSVVCRRDHPARTGDWGLDAWLAWPHVLVRTGDRTPSVVDRMLAGLGRDRTYGVIVEDLLLVPHVLSRTDFLFTGPREVFRPLLEPLGLALLDVPIALPTVPVAAMWLERYATDPGHRWFRTRIIAEMDRQLRPPEEAR
ncbi:MAG: LysR family transcriptional regulator [Myxococcota bacterium]